MMLHLFCIRIWQDSSDLYKRMKQAGKGPHSSSGDASISSPASRNHQRRCKRSFHQINTMEFALVAMIAVFTSFPLSLGLPGGGQYPKLIKINGRNGNEFQCKREGFFVDPKDCTRFYRCVDYYGLGQSFALFSFECPVGTIFDESISICNFPATNAVQCLTSSGTVSGGSLTSPVAVTRPPAAGSQTSTQPPVTSTIAAINITSTTTGASVTLDSTSSSVSPGISGGSSSTSTLSATSTPESITETTQPPSISGGDNSTPLIVLSPDFTTEAPSMNESSAATFTTTQEPGSTPASLGSGQESSSSLSVLDTSSTTTSSSSTGIISSSPVTPLPPVSEPTTTAMTGTGSISSTTKPQTSGSTIKPIGIQPLPPASQLSSISCNARMAARQTFYRFPTNCNLFYQCVWNGASFGLNMFACPAGLVFDEPSAICQHPENTTPCQASSATISTVTTTVPPAGSNPSISTGGSITSEGSSFNGTESLSLEALDLFSIFCKDSKFHRLPSNCNYFFQCVWNGVKYRMNVYACPNGQFYDEPTSSCQYPENTAPCQLVRPPPSTLITAGPTTVAPASSTSSNLLGIQFSLAPGSQYKCVVPGNFPYQFDCIRFYRCYEIMPGVLNGLLYICPSGYAFSPSTERCQKKESLPSCDRQTSHSSSLRAGGIQLRTGDLDAFFKKPAIFRWNF